METVTQFPFSGRTPCSPSSLLSPLPPLSLSVFTPSTVSPSLYFLLMPSNFHL